MPRLPHPFRRLRSLLRKPRLESDMAEELRLHEEMLVAEKLAEGMTPEQARREARREFGHVEVIKEACRDERGLPWLEELGRDMGYAARQLRKAPGFTIIAVLTLAIGIGLTTSIFSILSSTVLEPLPFPHSDRLVALQQYSLTRHNSPWATGGDLDAWKQASCFEGIAAVRPQTLNLTGIDEPVRIYGYFVWPGYFTTFGVQPFLGRNFSPPDEASGHGMEIILNYKLWVGQFGARADILNQTARVGDMPCIIVGVMPKGFQDEASGPLFYSPVPPALVNATDFRSHTVMSIVARLKPGVTIEQARSEMDTIARNVARDHPDTHRDFGVRVSSLLDYMTGEVSPILYTLLGAVGFLLLIACVNVANLLIARASGRQREIALRAALGASRGRIVRQLMVESLLLAAIGGGLGILLAQFSLHVILEFTPVALPRISEIHLDGWALAFSCGLTFATGVIFGILPALQASRVDLTHALKDGGRGSGHARARHRLRHTLVVIEIALALVLLVSAGLLSRSFIKFFFTDLGYNPQDLYVSRIQLPNSEYPDADQISGFADRLLEQFAAKPDLIAAALTTAFPHHQNPHVRILVDGQQNEEKAGQNFATFAAVTPDYFKVLENPPILGRAFDIRDRKGTPPVAVVSESFVRLVLPPGNPIGRRIALDIGKPDKVWCEIVGVVRDVYIYGPAQVPPPRVYLSFYQLLQQRDLIFIGHDFMEVTRVRPGAPNPAPLVTAAIHTVDPKIPVPPKLTCIAEYVGNSIEYYRFAVFLFAIFSSVALILAALGIYGVMAYAVSQRRQELGVRMALGAQPRDISRLIFGQAGRLVLYGVVIGAVVAAATSKLIRAGLVDTSPADPPTLVCIGLVLVGTALVACWLPARRATKVDPMVALRCD